MMAGSYPLTTFILHGAHGNQETISAHQLREYADLFGIPEMIPGRYSDLLLMDLYTSEQSLGLSPEHVAQEIASLESDSCSFMKPPSQFTRKPLKGLWHKHFLVPHLS